MKQDDPNIYDNELLYRLVPAVFARRNQQNQRIVEITSGVFNTTSLSALRLNRIDFNSARQADPTRGRPDKLNYRGRNFFGTFHPERTRRRNLHRE